ncbi:Mn-dependent DtxR family transcriptional regulator [Sedimentibacter acidaminivorans]|jgi:DtxR family transcriptional regulator, Mn-dependent transcriptional regulator|uniref:Mn-dependent DtxR family transcriptional regulator n=1 Tax=Sedimentibacter acidaminivorans TaxID=913099 RepID=A0ABS4GB65_9FIRM|nr:metal-dependent transcriptional regulator [Sedimentibacter acidaminivorans]MBP1924929.1 Mn-dependent DtxR family transcriptional regulator [Sedimentibacter acidaminivorans]
MIHESGEDYLETILLLYSRNGYVRSIDIANELNYTKPSVSRAMSILKKSNYIEIDKSGHILLTDKGKLTAEKIAERHKFIAEFLINVLGVSKENAYNDSCRIEHVISEESFQQIKEYLKTTVN